MTAAAVVDFLNLNARIKPNLDLEACSAKAVKTHTGLIKVACYAE
jgi:hypothetical protein